MGKRVEKCCMCIDLKIGAILWEIIVIISTLAAILYIICAWGSTQNLPAGDKAKLDEEWEYVCIVLICIVPTYGRSIQGIIQKRPNLMSLGLLCNVLWMGLIIYFGVSCLKSGNYIAALIAVPVLAIYYHGSAVVFAMYCKMKDEIKKENENANESSVVEYHADSTAVQPQPQPQAPKPEEV